MKLHISLLLAIGTLLGCNNSHPVQPVSLASCSNTQFPRQTEFKDIHTTIKAYSFINDFNATVTRYYINPPQGNDPNVFWNACNLPDQVKQANLLIRISGYKLAVPANADTDGSPIELTKIEVIKPEK